MPTRSKSEKGHKDIYTFVRGVACNCGGNCTGRRFDMVDERALVDLDGGGWFWYFVCDECRTPVHTGAERYPYCERLLIWNGKEKNVDCRAML